MRRLDGEDVSIPVQVSRYGPPRRLALAGVDKSAAEGCAPLAMVKHYGNARNRANYFASDHKVEGEV